MGSDGQHMHQCVNNGKLNLIGFTGHINRVKIVKDYMVPP